MKGVDFPLSANTRDDLNRLYTSFLREPPLVPIPEDCSSFGRLDDFKQ